MWFIVVLLAVGAFTALVCIINLTAARFVKFHEPLRLVIRVAMWLVIASLIGLSLRNV